MTQGFSRREWAQVVARVKQAEYRFGTRHTLHCLLCGKRWGRAACQHTHEDNQQIIELVKKEMA